MFCVVEGSHYWSEVTVEPVGRIDFLANRLSGKSTGFRWSNIGRAVLGNAGGAMLAGGKREISPFSLMGAPRPSRVQFRTPRPLYYSSTRYAG